MEQSKSLNSDNISKNRLQMGKEHTPDWTAADLEICAKSDELVKQGKMTYRRIR